jgi:probable HAF family extracellular repeat protein
MNATSSPVPRILILLCTLAVPMGLAAHEHTNKPVHHHYKLIDMRTFGGPASNFSYNPSQDINHRGVVAGYSDTPTPDPFPAFCFDPGDCFVAHAFQWQNGVLTDLGTLPGGASSQAEWINSAGLIAGIAQNGQTDPLIPGFPEFRAVLWQNGSITDLGTLDGGYESLAFGMNDSGDIVGPALNTVPDDFCLFAPGLCTTQTRAVLWQKGAIQDLGTLGGPDALAFFINQRSQVAGYSYVNSTPNSASDMCGANIPTADPFLWDRKRGMVDLGTLGGTCGFPKALNNRGQVVGLSDMPGDLTFHPFLWTEPGPIQDLGTLGGNNGFAQWINDRGDIVGDADLPGPAPQNHHAVLWRKNGAERIDLGVLPGYSCSRAFSVNSRGQVVGSLTNSDLCPNLDPSLNYVSGHAFLWENGGPIVDLNSLIPPGSSLDLAIPYGINDSGEIVGSGLPPGCAPQDNQICGHAFLLIPCDESHPDIEGCDYSPAEESEVAASHATTEAAPQRRLTPKEINNRMRALLMNRQLRFGPKQ